MNWDYLGSALPKAIHTLPSRCQSHVRIFPCFCPSHCGLAGCLSPNGAVANHSPVTTSLLRRSEFRIWDDSSGRKISFNEILPQTVTFSFVLMILNADQNYLLNSQKIVMRSCQITFWIQFPRPTAMTGSIAVFTFQGLVSIWELWLKFWLWHNILIRSGLWWFQKLCYDYESDLDSKAMPLFLLNSQCKGDFRGLPRSVITIIYSVNRL